MRITTTVIAALLLASCSSAPSDSPTGAMFSADEALKSVFDGVCAPAILESKSIETLARAKSMIEVDASGANAGAGDREWRLASLGYASVMAWGDGTCMVSVEHGDSARHSAYLVSSMDARGVKLTRGKTTPAANGGANTAWCTSESRPIVLGIITPTQAGRRAAVVANLFRARDAMPAFCKSS
jgi:hypothetical protein